MRDQVRREAVKQGGKGAMLLKKSNFTKLHSPLNTSRMSSDAAREEMMAMVYFYIFCKNSKQKHLAVYTFIGKKMVLLEVSVLHF